MPAWLNATLEPPRRSCRGLSTATQVRASNNKESLPALACKADEVKHASSRLMAPFCCSFPLPLLPAGNIVALIDALNISQWDELPLYHPGEGGSGLWHKQNEWRCPSACPSSKVWR
jgi:hypothetical protein